MTRCQSGEKRRGGESENHFPGLDQPVLREYLLIVARCVPTASSGGIQGDGEVWI